MTFESTNKTKLLHPELSYKISGILFKVHNTLGRFCREIQYGDLLEIEFKNAGIIFEREKLLPIQEIGQEDTSNKVDFLIENKILLDLKAKKFITKEDYFQMQRYLKSSKLKLGLIVNFRNTYIKAQRVINSYWWPFVFVDSCVISRLASPILFVIQFCSHPIPCQWVFCPHHLEVHMATGSFTSRAHQPNPIANIYLVTWFYKQGH